MADDRQWRQWQRNAYVHGVLHGIGALAAAGGNVDDMREDPLSGEWAGDTSPCDVWRQATNDEAEPLGELDVDSLADSWQAGYDDVVGQVWSASTTEADVRAYFARQDEDEGARGARVAWERGALDGNYAAAYGPIVCDESGAVVAPSAPDDLDDATYGEGFCALAEWALSDDDDDAPTNPYDR